MEPQSVSEVGETRGVHSPSQAHLPSPVDQPPQSIGEISQIVILRCAFRAMEVRGQDHVSEYSGRSRS
jgi:hypothetical protein